MINWRHFGRDIKHERDRRGIGHRKAAGEIGTSHATVCRAENAKAVNTETFMSGCDWMRKDPLKYYSKED